MDGARSGHAAERADDRARRRPRRRARRTTRWCRPFASRWSSAGLKTTSWITDTGEVVREESPLGLMTVREPAERAQGLAVPGARAGRPAAGRGRGPDDERADRRAARCPAARLRLEGADLSVRTISTAPGRRVDGNVIELVDPRIAAGRSAPIRCATDTSPPSRCSRATIPRSAPRPSRRCAAPQTTARAPSG